MSEVEAPEKKEGGGNVVPWWLAIIFPISWSSDWGQPYTTYNRTGWAVLAGLTCITMAMRFYRLDSVPVGLNFDEAFNGLDALNLVHLNLTKWPVFFEGNSGREPLFVWLSGLAHALFTPSIWTARCVAALSGSLLTPAFAWLGWQVAPMLGVHHRQLFSLWCAVAVLAMLWSQIFSRYGIRPILFVLMQSLMWAAMWRAWQRPPPAVGAWLIAGFLAGLSVYTYLPARLLPLTLLLLLAFAICFHSQRLRKNLPGIVHSLAIAILIVAPLAFFFLRDPFSSYNRIEQVAVLDAKGVLSNLSAALQMFILSGDSSSIHNLSTRPALDPLMALPFLVGLGLSLIRFWRLGCIFLLAGLSAGLLPTVLSTNAPNFMRSIGVLPFVALITAFGAERTVHFLKQLGPRMYRFAQVMMWVVFGASIGLVNWAYFSTWASTAEQFHDYDEGFVWLVREVVNERENVVYINTHGGLLHPTVFYLLTAHDTTARFYDGQECLPVATTYPARYLHRKGYRTRLQARSYYPKATPQSNVIFDRSGQPWLAEIRNPAGEPAVFPEMVKHEVQMADGISLAGYSLSQNFIQEGRRLRLRLFWRASKRPSVDYTTFIHLSQLGEDGFTTRIRGFDRQPGDGNCPTIHWLPGEIIIDQVILDMPADLPQEELYLGVGFYFESGGVLRHLPIESDDAKKVSSDNKVLLGPFSVNP